MLTSLAALTDDQPQYVLEGSVFVAGAAVQWLRDGLKMFADAAEVEALAEGADPQHPIVFVPALVGLGAPHWMPEAQGVIFGVTRGTRREDLARAALEGVALQVADLLEAAGRDCGQALTSLQVDGGMARNAFFLQMQADLLGIDLIHHPKAKRPPRAPLSWPGSRWGFGPTWMRCERSSSLADDLSRT